MQADGVWKQIVTEDVTVLVKSWFGFAATRSVAASGRGMFQPDHLQKLLDNLLDNFSYSLVCF